MYPQIVLDEILAVFDAETVADAVALRQLCGDNPCVDDEWCGGEKSYSSRMVEKFSSLVGIERARTAMKIMNASYEREVDLCLSFIKASTKTIGDYLAESDADEGDGAAPTTAPTL